MQPTGSPTSMPSRPPTPPDPLLLELPDELLGPRVLLRPYRAGDGAALWEAIEESRERLAAWMPWPVHHRCPADSEAWVRRSASEWLLRTNLVIGIWEKETGGYLGGTGMHPIDWAVPSFEIGYWLRSCAEGRGYVTEAVRLLCGLAFDRMGANRVSIRCDTRNARSAAVPRRLGFTLEAMLRSDSRDTAGELRDTWLFSLLPSEHAAWAHE